MKCGIYKITNLINQKSYIGQSIDIDKRFRHHRAAAFNPGGSNYNYPLYQAFRKYGVHNFSFEILEECQKEELDQKEKYYIDKFNTLSSKGYNQVDVQQGGTTLKPEIVQQIIQELQNNSVDNTETIGKKFGVSGRTVRAINKGESWHDSKINYPIRSTYIGLQSSQGNIKNYCKRCGKEILKNSNYCIECIKIVQRIVERPSREELKQLIRKDSFIQIGKFYGVSDNTIRKWCVSYNLPSKKKDIKQYSDSEWKQI